MTENNASESGASSKNDDPIPDKLREHGVEEAKRVRDDISGGDEQHKTQRAILDRERELTGFHVEKRRTKCAIEDAESDIEDLRATLTRLRDLDGTPRIFERLPDGTLVSVPAEGQNEFEDRLKNDLGDTQTHLDAQQDRLEAIERGIAINECAINWLENELRSFAESGGNDDTENDTTTNGGS